MNRHARATRRLPAAIGVALLVIGQLAGPVSGNHGGRPVSSLFACDRPVTPPRCTSVADDPRHLVHFDDSLSEEMATAMRHAMAEAYGPTDLVMVEHSRLTRKTDVVVFSGDYGENGAAGWVYCPTGSPQGFNQSRDRWCRQQEMHFNLNPRYGVFFGDEESRNHVACHELGHTVGLRHWGNPPQTNGTDVGATCMNANTPNGPTSLHQFDIDHINAYGYSRGPSHRHILLSGAPGGSGIASLVPWSGSLETTEIEAPASLAELVASSDAVIRGEVVAVVPGRSFGDTDGPALHYAAATVRVDELLAGSLPARHAATLTLEIPLFDGPASIADLPAWGESLLFVRNKGESARAAGLGPEEQRREADFYRLMTFGSLVASDGGVALTDPDAAILAGLGGQPFPAAVEAVRAVAP